MQEYTTEALTVAEAAERLEQAARELKADLVRHKENGEHLLVMTTRSAIAAASLAYEIIMGREMPSELRLDLNAEYGRPY